MKFYRKFLFLYITTIILDTRTSDADRYEAREMWIDLSGQNTDG